MAGFERCSGCPEVKEGEVCNLLGQFVQNEINLNDPNFKRVFFRCKKINPDQAVMGAKAVITKDGATYMGELFSDALADLMMEILDESRGKHKPEGS
jgi:hypothetical protein